MMAKKKTAAKPASVPVEVHKHVADKRPNIPTRETAPFAAGDDGPQPFIIRRDRSLDPQLVWKGRTNRMPGRWKYLRWRCTFRRRFTHRPSSRT